MQVRLKRIDAMVGRIEGLAGGHYRNDENPILAGIRPNFRTASSEWCQAFGEYGNSRLRPCCGRKRQNAEHQRNHG
jgi:hypothetical protein